MSKNGKNRPSILNWMGSLILLGIPGVNLIFLILTIIFAKTGAKRNFAIAALLLMLWPSRTTSPARPSRCATRARRSPYPD